MTTNETIVFNCFAVMIGCFAIYWALVIFPAWFMTFGESLYYFLTGITI